MQQQSQIIEDIRKLAEGEINAPWDQDYENVLHDAIHGNERTFPHQLVFRADSEHATQIKTDIPWKLIKCLVSHPEIKGHIHTSGVRLFNAHITTDCMDDKKHVPVYDFFLCEASVPLLLKNCLFDGELQFDYCKFKSLGFVDSTIPSVHLRAAEVEGGATFEGCFFNKVGELSIKAHEAKVGGTLCLRKCVAVGGIRLMGSRIEGDVDATGAFVVSTRYGEYFWDRAKTLDPHCVGCLRSFYGLFDVFKFDMKQSVEALHDIMPLKQQALPLKHYEVGDSRFKALDVSNAVVGGNVKLRRNFRALGEVSLNSAQIGGAVLIRGAVFFQPDGVALSMDVIKVRRGIYIQEEDKKKKDNKPFVAHGSVSMRGATVTHRLVCSNAFFYTPHKDADELLALRSNPMREREAYALFAKRLRVGGDVILNKALAKGGDVPGALGSFVSFENARIGGRLFFRGTPNQEMYTSGNDKTPFLNLDFAKVAGSVHLAIESATAPISGTCQVSLRSSTAGSIDVSECNVDKVKWDLEGLEYKAVENYNVDDWIAKLLTTSIQPYDVFMSFLKNTGDEIGLRKVGIAKENEITNRTKPSLLRMKVSKSLPMGASFYGELF